MIKAEIYENKGTGYHVEIKANDTCAYEMMCLIDTLISNIEKNTELKYNEIIKEIKETRKQSTVKQYDKLDNTNE